MYRSQTLVSVDVAGPDLTVWIALFEFLSKHITSIHVFAYPLSNKKKTLETIVLLLL